MSAMPSPQNWDCDQMASVKWSDHAMACMKEQAKYIAEQSHSKEIAWKWANDVFDVADQLADFPRTGHPLPEFPDTPYLEILARKFFRVIYRIHGNIWYCRKVGDGIPCLRSAA